MRALANLLSHLNLDNKTVLTHIFTVRAVDKNMLFNKEKAKHSQLLSVLVFNSICKTPKAENIAGSGLNFKHLEAIYKRDGENGLTNTFMMKSCEGM